MVKATSGMIQPLRTRTAEGKAAVREERERLRPVVLGKLGLQEQNTWITQERLLEGTAWAHHNRDLLTATFASYAVSKLVRGDVRCLKDAVVFVRQFLKRTCDGKLLTRVQSNTEREYAWQPINN